MKKMTLNNLYLPISAYKSHFLQVSDLHTIYIEEAGNPKGKPVLFLHGGPGGGISPIYRQFFDPEFYRIILIDQRGCGKSIPHAELQENTTWDLVEDIEKVRDFLNIENWVVFGGSWGSTLALCYAIKHTEKVLGLILRGIFLCRKKEIDWFYEEGASKLFPDHWEKYLAPINTKNQKTLLECYYELLCSENYETRLTAAKAWSQWEAGTSKLEVSQDSIDEFEDPELALAFARIECHYFINKIFVSDDNWILEQAKEKLNNIPISITQGRYDVVCPAETAWDLHQALPHSKLVIVPNAGHSSLELSISKELLAATNEFKKYY
jgi:proline iminopeptidase